MPAPAIARTASVLPLLLLLGFAQLVVVRADAGATKAPPDLPAPIAEITLDASARYTLPLRTSADGRWAIVSLGHGKDAVRGWGHHGLVLIDLAAGREVRRWERARPGRELPHFSADGRFLAWVARGEADSEEGGDPTIERWRLGRELVHERIPLPPIAGERGVPLLAALDPDGSHALVHREVEEGDPFLARVSLEDGAEQGRFPHFRSPGYGRQELDAVLTEEHIIAHTRPPGEHGGDGYRLVVIDAGSGEELVRSGAFVSNATPRYRVSADGRTIWNGTGAFDLVEILLPARGDAEGTATERVLEPVRDLLYSHFFELTVSPDERDLIAWSRERRVWVHHDRETGTRREIELGDRRGECVGIDAQGRAWLASRDTLLSIDLRDGESTLVVRDEGTKEARLDRTGRTLVVLRATVEDASDASVESRTRWGLRIHRVSAD